MSIQMRPMGRARSAMVGTLRGVCVPAMAVTLLAAGPALARDGAVGRVVTQVVHGASLENTVTRESPDRSVSIYLPPSYDSAAKKHYPVIYLLHGVGGTDREWVESEDPWASVQSVMDNGIAAGLLKEMIIVMPNEHTNLYGSFYTDSSVTGRWEVFTTKELVAFVDGKYRTIADAGGRGILGHSMGGYGALRLGMKNPDVYSVAYGMNPALPGWRADLTINNPEFIYATTARTADDIRPPRYAAGIINLAQAFSPNPQKPPFFVDLPYAEVDGKVVPAQPAFSEWEANFLSNMAPQYREQLSRLRGYRFDSGYEDMFQFIPPNARELSRILTTYGIDHVFEEYNGDHANRMWGEGGRLYTEALPYFSRLLEPAVQDK